MFLDCIIYGFYIPLVVFIRLTWTSLCIWLEDYDDYNDKFDDFKDKYGEDFYIVYSYPKFWARKQSKRFALPLCKTQFKKCVGFSCKMYLFKLTNVFVWNSKCICLNGKRRYKYFGGLDCLCVQLTCKVWTPSSSLDGGMHGNIKHWMEKFPMATFSVILPKVIWSHIGSILAGSFVWNRICTAAAFNPAGCYWLAIELRSSH